MSLTLPPSVLLALWLPSPSSRGAAVVEGQDGAHTVEDPTINDSDGSGDPDDPDDPLPLSAWMARVGRPTRVTAVLPAPADPIPGLPLALEAGEAVIHESGPGLRRLLVPSPSGTSMVWRVSALPTAAPPFDASQARREVHRATQEAIEALIELDLARERPDLADALNDLITAVIDPRILPPAVDPRRVELLERSARLLGICELALADDGAAATALQARRRAEVLRPLAAVARRGVSAATEWWAPALGAAG